MKKDLTSKCNLHVGKGKNYKIIFFLNCLMILNILDSIYINHVLRQSLDALDS